MECSHWKNTGSHWKNPDTFSFVFLYKTCSYLLGGGWVWSLRGCTDFKCFLHQFMHVTYFASVVWELHRVTVTNIRISSQSEKWCSNSIVVVLRVIENEHANFFIKKKSNCTWKLKLHASGYTVPALKFGSTVNKSTDKAFLNKRGVGCFLVSEQNLVDVT